LKESIKLKIAALGATNFIIVLVNTILFPVFPVMARALDLTLRDLSWMVVLVSFPAAVVCPLGGLLADRWSRKHVITISLGLYGLGGLLSGLAVLLMERPFYVILAGRLMQGFGSATPMYLTTALAGDIFQSSERHQTVGLLEAANGTGKIMSPLIGATFGLLAWYAPFFLYPLVSLPVALAIWYTVQEPGHPPVAWEEQKKAFKLFQNLSRVLTLAAGVVTIFVLIGTMFWLSDVLEDKIDGGKIIRGIILSLPVIALMLTTFLSAFFGKHLGTRYTVGIGMLLKAVSLVSIPFLFETLLFWPAIALVGVGSGMILPAMDTVSTSVAKREYRGILTTTYGASRSLGAALAPYIFAILMDAGILIPFFPIAAGAAVTGILVLLFLNNEEILPQELLPEEEGDNHAPGEKTKSSESETEGNLPPEE